MITMTIEKLRAFVDSIEDTEEVAWGANVVRQIPCIVLRSKVGAVPKRNCYVKIATAMYDKIFQDGKHYNRGVVLGKRAKEVWSEACDSMEKVYPELTEVKL